MMSAFEYTHYEEIEGSSVVSEVVYDEQTRRLVVILHNGTVAGYEGVDKLFYQSLVNADSVGAYWNRFVRKHFNGFDTNDIDSFRDRKEPLVSSNDYVFGAWKPAEVGKPEEVVVPVNRRFEVSYVLDNTWREGQVVKVNAADTSSAVEAFNKAAEALGWKKVSVRSVTQFFD
jgi:predicted glutamine amidotransferase